MQTFRIEGGHAIHGEVTPSGNKNAALPLLAACLLTEQPVVLRNVPDIGDVRTMCGLLESLGVQIERLDPHTWRVQAAEVRRADLDPDICRRMRASILLAGPMTVRSGGVSLPPPGGDVIGRRRIDTHILALRALGADVAYKNREFNFSASRRLQRGRDPARRSQRDGDRERHHGQRHGPRRDHPAQCRLRATRAGPV